MCPLLDSLSRVIGSLGGLPSPVGLGAEDVLRSQVQVLAGSAAALQRELAVRMAALEAASAPGPADVRGEAARAGIPTGQAGQLRSLGLFAREHPQLGAAWTSGAVTLEQMRIVRDGSARLPLDLRRQLVAMVLPHLPALDPPGVRRLVAFAVDQLQPGDPDTSELSEHNARNLVWSSTPGGGIALQGYLPAAEADAFTRAIQALAEELRVEGDGCTPGQRHADALAALVAKASTASPASGGGLPAVLTLTVSLPEAGRVAARNPGTFGTGFTPRPRSGSTAGDRLVGDGTVRFGLCCAAITPVLHDPPGGLLGKIANTRTEPLAVGRAVRLATPAQRRALALRDGGCVIPGCTVAAPYTQPHHVTGWAIDGPTDLSNLVSLCWVHHRQTELGRYRFTDRTQPKPRGALDHPNWWITPPRH